MKLPTQSFLSPLPAAAPPLLPPSQFRRILEKLFFQPERECKRGIRERTSELSGPAPPPFYQALETAAGPLESSVATCPWTTLSLGFLFALSAKCFQGETGNAPPGDILLVAWGGGTGVFALELGRSFPEPAFLYGFQ